MTETTEYRKGQKRVILVIRVSDETYKQLKDTAREMDMTASSLARVMIEESLKAIKVNLK